MHPGGLAEKCKCSGEMLHLRTEGSKQECAVCLTVVKLLFKMESCTFCIPMTHVTFAVSSVCGKLAESDRVYTLTP